jgi:hypothetical protein
MMHHIGEDLIFTRQQELHTFWITASAGVDTTLKVHTISISTLPMAGNKKLQTKWTRAHDVSIKFNRKLSITSKRIRGNTYDKIRN